VLAYGSMTTAAADTDVLDVANINSNSNTCSEQHRICTDDREMENGIKLVFFVVVSIVGTILVVY